MQNQIGAFEAKNTLGTLLDRVERGESLVITRRGIPVARLSPIESGIDRARSARAVEGLLATSRGLTLGGISIRELITAGQK